MPILLVFGFCDSIYSISLFLQENDDYFADSMAFLMLFIGSGEKQFLGAAVGMDESAGADGSRRIRRTLQGVFLEKDRKNGRFLNLAK